MPYREAGDHAGIQSAAERHANRHIRADDDPPHFVQIRAQDFDRVPRQGRNRRNVPIPSKFRHGLVRRQRQQMPRAQLANSFERSCRLGNETEMEIVIDRVEIRFDRDRARRRQCGDFRCEIHRPVVARGIQQGLFAESIAQQGQLLARFIPDRRCERATQAMHERFAVPVVQEGQDFAVAVRAQLRASRDQLLAQFHVVVDFTTDDGEGTLAFARKRLGATGQVDDAQAAMRQRDAPPLEPSITVRAAMR